MAVNALKALHNRYYEEAWNHGNLAVIDEVVAVDYRANSKVQIEGSAALKQYISAFRAAFPDIHFTIEDQIAEGNKVVSRWTVSGTHRGTLMGIAPTGKRGMVRGVSVVVVVDGKIQEDWISWDQLGMWEQLGVVAPPAQTL